MRKPHKLIPKEKNPMALWGFTLFPSDSPFPSPSSSSISDRFLDIPEPLREKITKAANDAVRESLEEVAKEIQFLSLDEDPNTLEEVRRLKAEVEKAERLGFEVKVYKERLAELEYILNWWVLEKMERLGQLRRRKMLLRMKMEKLEAEEEKECKALRDRATVFNNVASAPWRWEKEGSNKAVEREIF